MNKAKKLSIGEYPTISLADARNQRNQAKRLLANGLDPSSTKKEIKIARAQDGANTFEVIARE